MGPEGLITMEDFKKVKLLVGEVVGVADHPKADKLILLKVNVGSKTKQLVAGLKGHYSGEQLVGKRVVVLDNLQPAVLRGEKSEGMVLAAIDGARVVLLTVDGQAAAGSPIA